MSKPDKKSRPTIRDVARLAQVAPITVSRVINNSGYISEETRDRVEQAIDQLNYIPNSLSQSLRYQKTDLITLLVSDVTNPFWTTVTRGVEDVCSRESLNVILCNTDENSEKLEKYVRIMLQRQTDGFLFVPTSDDVPLIETIVSNNVPIVLLDRILPGISVPVVYSDNESGAYRVVTHLLELGHRRIGVLSGSLAASTSRQRVNGYFRALSDHGIATDETLIDYGTFTHQSGYEMAHRMFERLNPLPTALFAANNFIAYGVQQALEERGLQVPEDISLVTFDDVPFHPFPKPYLTTAAQNPYEVGRKAAELLVQQIKAGELLQMENVMLPVDLIIRNSTCRLKS